MAPVSVTREDISAAADKAGLRGCCVCVHSSLRSFSRVDGGPETVLSGLLDLGCTVVVPTFSWSLQVPPPASDRPAQNGTRYDAFAGRTTGTGRLYDPSSNEIDANMGAVPAAALRMPGRVRGNHPVCSFTAVGPRAEELIGGQAPLDLCAPLRAVASAEGLRRPHGCGPDADDGASSGREDGRAAVVHAVGERPGPESSPGRGRRVLRRVRRAGARAEAAGEAGQGWRAASGASSLCGRC